MASVKAEPVAAPAPRGLVPLIGLLSMIGPFSIDTYLPSFPDIAGDFGVGLAAMAQTLGVYLIAFAVATLVWGPLADAFGRRRVVIGSLLLFVLTSFGCALADSFDHLLWLRLLQGIAASGGMVIGRAVIRDVYHGPQAQRAMAHVMLVFALAPALAPVIGGWLHEWAGWRSVFHFLALYALTVLLLVMWRLPETHPEGRRQSIHPQAVAGHYWRALRHGRFLALVLAVSFWFGGLFLYIAGSPAIIFDHLGLGAGSFAVQFVPMVVGVMLGSFMAGRLSHRWSPQRTVDSALLLMGVALLANLAQAWWLTPTPLHVVAPLVLYAFAVALAMPNLTVMALDCFPHNRGMASAVQGFVQMGANALIAAVAVPLVAASLRSFSLMQGGFLVAALLLWGFASRGERRIAP